MSYLRFVIVLLTLFILSDSFSLVFAQRAKTKYDFEGKSTNIGGLDTPEQNRLSIMPGGSPYLKLNPNMRFRYLSGTFT